MVPAARRHDEALDLRPAGGPHLNVPLLRALVGADLLARTSYGLCRTPVLPLYAASLGAGPAWIGAIGAASTVTGIALKSPSGALSDVLGRRRLLLAGLLVFAAAPFLYLAAAASAALLAIRLFHGLATALYSPVSMAAVAEAAGARRGEGLAWLSSAKTVGALAGALLGGLVLSSSASGGAPASAAFARAFLLAGALGALALLLLLAVRGALPERRAGGPRRSAYGKLVGGMRAVARDRGILAASACEGVQNASVGVVEQFLPVYAVLVAGLSPFEAGLLFGCQTVTAVASKPVLGRWSDRRGRRGLVAAGMVLCAVPFAALPWTTALAPLLALATLFGLGEALVTSASAALVADLAERRALGAAMGVFGTIGDAGHAAGPLLAGAVIAAALGASAQATPGDAPAFRIAFALVAAAVLATGLGFAASGRGEQR